MKKKEVQLFEIRAFLYEVAAAALYAEPTAEILENLQERLAGLTESSRVWPDEPLWASVRDLLESISGADTEDLAVDYAGLFLSGRDGSICPSESCYLENSIYGNSTLKVMELYAEAGFVKDDAFTEPEDHIALECAFMGLMAGELANEAAERGAESDRARDLIKQQIAFLAGHLLKWVPLWADRVERGAETAFYRSLARLVGILTAADQRLLASYRRKPE